MKSVRMVNYNIVIKYKHVQYIHIGTCLMQIKTAYIILSELHQLENGKKCIQTNFLKNSKMSVRAPLI